MQFYVGEEILSDGSYVYNVKCHDDAGMMITIGATSREAAEHVARVLNDDSLVAWVEVDSV